MRRYPESATSKTYEQKPPTFNNVKPKEFLQMMNDFKTAIDGTGTTSSTGKSQLLCTMLHGEALRYFEVLESQVGSTTNVNIKLIKDSLTD